MNTVKLTSTKNIHLKINVTKMNKNQKTPLFNYKLRMLIFLTFALQNPNKRLMLW